MNPTIAGHEALPSVGLHGLALAGYPPRRYTERSVALCVRITTQ